MVLEFIPYIVKSRRVDLLAVDVLEDLDDKTKTNQTFEVLVDKTMNELVISLVTRDDAVLKVGRFSKPQLADFSFCNKSLEVSSAKLCYVQNPEQGKWTLSLEAKSAFSLRVSAASNITFDFGFEVSNDDGKADTNGLLCEPVAGTKNTLFIKLNKTSKLDSLTGEIISLEGHAKPSSFSLQLVPKESDVYYGSFTPTNRSYHLRINGKIKSGLEFQRVTPVTFSSFANPIQEFTNCTSRNMHTYSISRNSSSKLMSSKQSWLTFCLMAIALSGFILISG